MKFPASIAIEGIDGSGKGTQARILAENIRKIKRMAGPDLEATVVSFPRYETEWGERVREYLNGSMGGAPVIISPYLAANLYTLDRVEYYASTRRHPYKENEIFVFDRHMGSNMAHQGAKIDCKEAREKFYMHCLETEVMCGVAVPELIIYLRSSPKVASTAIKGRDSLDGHETNISYLEKARAAYDEVAEYFNWKIVDCLASEGEMRSVADIAAEVFSIVVTHGGVKNV